MRRVALPTAIAAVVIPLAALAYGASSHPASQHTKLGRVSHRAIARAAQAGAVSTEQRALGVLRRDTTADDAMPSQLAGKLRTIAIDGANPDLARRIRIAGVGDYYVVPGANNYVCLFDSGGAGGCSPASEAVAGHIVLADACRAADLVRVAGILPDGTRSAKVSSEGGDTSVAFAGNVYALDIPKQSAGTSRVSWGASDGQAEGIAVPDTTADPKLNCPH